MIILHEFSVLQRVDIGYNVEDVILSCTANEWLFGQVSGLLPGGTDRDG
jgi:hypothetical protein